MKRIVSISTASAFIFFIFISFSFIGKKSGCDSNAVYEQALKKLSSFSLLKDYRVYLKAAKKNTPAETVYFPMTLNRGVKYKFFGAQSGEYEGKLTISLFTLRNGKPDFLFATNYENDLNKIYESIEFQSESTMNCLIAFAFKDGKEGCGVGISSFLKN